MHINIIFFSPISYKNEDKFLGEPWTCVWSLLFATQFCRNNIDGPYVSLDSFSRNDNVERKTRNGSIFICLNCMFIRPFERERLQRNKSMPIKP